MEKEVIRAQFNEQNKNSKILEECVKNYISAMNSIGFELVQKSTIQSSSSETLSVVIMSRF